MIKKEVQPPAPEAMPSPPWLTLHVDVSVAAILGVIVGVPCVAALLTVGSPDLLDAIIYFVWNRP